MAQHFIHPAIIEEEKRRRERERTPAQIPLYDEVREIPPGWEPDPNCPGGYRRKEEGDNDGDRDRSDRGVVIIQF